MLLYWRHYIAYQATSLVFRAVFFNQGALAPWGTASTGHKLPLISIMSWHDECGQATSTIITNDALRPGWQGTIIAIVMAASGGLRLGRTASFLWWWWPMALYGQDVWCHLLVCWWRPAWLHHAVPPTASRRRQRSTFSRSPPPLALWYSAGGKNWGSDVKRRLGDSVWMGGLIYRGALM